VDEVQERLAKAGERLDEVISQRGEVVEGHTRIPTAEVVVWHPPTPWCDQSLKKWVRYQPIVDGLIEDKTWLCATCKQAMLPILN
jgi:hypothetical protein